MKYYFFLTVFLFGSFFVGQNSWALNFDIIINEIGAYPTSTHEWIEIWNKGTDDVDIKDWKFWENDTNHSLNITTSSDSIVSANEYAVICQDADMFKIDNPNFIGSVFDSSWNNLSENGESIGLKDETGNFVEQFSYTSTTQFSLERKNPFENTYSSENWQENNSGNSLGFKNSNFYHPESLVATTTTTSTDISANIFISATSSDNIFLWSFVKLNEIVSDPVSGNELVELYNSGTSTVNLFGGSICDSSFSSCKMLDGMLNGHDWLVADMFTERYFNNTGDSVILFNSNNENIDRINYGTSSFAYPEKGQSIIRLVDGLDSDLDSDWDITSKLTLDAANELIQIPENISGGGTASNNNISSHTNDSPNSNTTSKIIKINSSTKAITVMKDSVNISWKLNSPYGLDIGEIGIFSAKGTADPRGGEVAFKWNFGDGVSSTGKIVEHNFVTSGIFIVSVTASSSASTFGRKEFLVRVGTAYSIANAQIKIDSFQVTSTEDIEEYIQLKNYLEKPQNISGWKIKNKSGKEYELPENTIIAPSGTLKFYKTIHHLSFDKDGDEIRLTSPNDIEINKIILIEEKKIKEVKIVSNKILSNWLSVRGVVTVEPKTFGQQFFYISDGQSGFQIYQFKKDFPDIKIGDYLEVGGETSIIDGINRIKIKNKNSIRILKRGEIVNPISLILEDVDSDLIGSLVKISGDITEIKSNLMYVDDGSAEMIVFFKKGATINKKELKEGDKVEVTGILIQGKDGWQVLPRSISDITITGHIDEALAGQFASDPNKQDNNRNNYLTTTAGGLSALLLGFVAKARGAVVMAGAKKVVSLASRAIKRG